MDDAPLNTASEPWAGRAEPLPHAAYPCKCLGKPHQDWTCNRKPPVGKAHSNTSIGTTTLRHWRCTSAHLAHRCRLDRIWPGTLPV